MARTALVIGLGGTGQWVLTYLKKDLMEANDGKMPDNVRLLCFDTVAQARAQVSSGGTQEEEVRIGEIQLKPKQEFVHLGGDVYDLTQIVAEDSTAEQRGLQRLPHIASWYQANHWLTLPRAMLVIDEGAGKLRQLGRIGLFNDLSDAIQSRVWTHLDTKITELSNQARGQRIEIIVVGSFAGGTGSGLFIDVALLARHRARGAANLLRGYFVLPHAFESDPDADMLARTFAAWRELNRFMVISKDFPLPELVYNSKNEALRVKEIKTRIFDACYLVDGRRNGVRLAEKPELSVHPTIADAISAILDDQAGTRFTEEIVANLAAEYAKHPGETLYSVVGTYSYKVPVYYAQQDFAHRLTVSWLNTLLKPLHDDPEDRLRVTRVDATSPNDASRTGRDEALSPLQSPQEYEGQSESPTLFFGRLAEIAGSGAVGDPTVVEQYARGAVGGKSWQDVFTSLPDRADMRAVIDRVKQEAGYKIANIVKPSRVTKDPPRSFPKKAEANVPAFVKDHYGWRNTDGSENRGRYGTAVDECGAAQALIFARQLDLWLRRSLMSGDKSGRLGYAYDLLSGVVEQLDGVLTFLEKVQRKREELKPHLKVHEEREQRAKAMRDFANRRMLLGLIDHPQAHETQLSYLKAEQAVIDARKDEILQRSVLQTVRAMRKQAATMQTEVGRWIGLLATGDSTQSQPGLYALLDRQRREIERTRQADEELVLIQKRIGDLVYPQGDEAKEIAQMMAGVSWEIQNDAVHPDHDPNEPTAFQMNLRVAAPGQTPVGIEQPTGEELDDARSSLTQRNLRALQTYAVRRFSDLPEDTRVAERLRKVYTPATLSQDIGDHPEPLYQRRQGREGGAANLTEFIRVSLSGVDPATRTFMEGRKEGNEIVVEGLVQIRRVNRGLPPGTVDQKRVVDVVSSTDAHKLTIVRTDDLIPVEHFQSWAECQAAYLANRSMPPQLNHNFPAEANAARYEKKLSEKRKRQYRVFHPWVVMLLEHPDRLEQFFLAWALGWIQVRTDEAVTWYELTVPGFEQPFKLTPDSNSLWSTFQAARFFVLEGLDQTAYSQWFLDYREIETALKEEEKLRGADAWLTFLQEQAAPRDAGSAAPEHLVSPWLRRHVQELDGLGRRGQQLPQGEPANYQQAYVDLADVAVLMFEERGERKQVQLGRGGPARPVAPATR